MQQCRAGLLVPAAAEKDALEGEAQRRIVGLHPPARRWGLLRREHAERGGEHGLIADKKVNRKLSHELPQVAQQEEVPHVSKDVHARVHPGTAQPLAAHGEDAPHGVADAARSVARQEQEHALWPAEAGAW